MNQMPFAEQVSLPLKSEISNFGFEMVGLRDRLVCPSIHENYFFSQGAARIQAIGKLKADSPKTKSAS